MARIYIDSYCYGNPGPGAWAYRIFYPEEIKPVTSFGKEYYTTNNRAELMALVNALKVVQSPDPITVFTGNTYIIKLVEKNNWVKIRKNLDLIDELKDLLSRKSVSFQLVDIETDDILYAVKMLAKKVADGA